MENIEEKMESIQMMLEHLELKIHRKIMEKANEKELTIAHLDRD